MYAALVLAANAAAPEHLHELSDPRVRAALALVAAVAVLFIARADRLAVTFIAWFGTFGLIVIAGQLWQRYVDDGTGNFIYIDAVTFTVSVASEVILAMAAVTLFAARRGV